MITGVWLEELSWIGAKARFDADAVVVIPIGAASKAHGAHLPLKTDALAARVTRWEQRLIERLPVVAAPVVGFGFYPAFTSFAGSPHLTAETFKALVRELIREPRRARRAAHCADQHRRVDPRSRCSTRSRRRPAHWCCICG